VACQGGGRRRAAAAALLALLWYAYVPPFGQPAWPVFAHFLGATVFAAASILGILAFIIPKRPVIGFLLLVALPGLVLLIELMLMRFNVPGAGLGPFLGGIAFAVILVAAAYGRWKRK